MEKRKDRAQCPELSLHEELKSSNPPCLVSVEQQPKMKIINQSGPTKRKRVKCLGKRKKLHPRREKTEDGIKKRNKQPKAVSSSKKKFSKASSPKNFIRGVVPNFWQCPKCKDLPLSFRAKHSVIFYGGNYVPTITDYPTMQIHFDLCDQRCLEVKGVNFDEMEEESSCGALLNTEEDFRSEQAPEQTSRKTRRRKSKNGEGKVTNLNKTTQNIENIPKDMQSQHQNQLASVRIPFTNNGLVHPSKDKKLTATIDMLVMSQVERCYYVMAADTTPYLRQKPIPENYPGVQCKYCAKSSEKKPWFFNGPIQLSTGFPKIEQHLMFSCKSCPKSIKHDIATAKSQEERERIKLRLKSGDKITRRQYATLVFSRLGVKPLR